GSMLTDKPPRKSNLAAFTESDRMRTIDLPQDGSLRIIAKSVECAMKAGTTTNAVTPAKSFWKRRQDSTEFLITRFASSQPGRCECVKTGRANSSGITPRKPC